MNRRHDRSRSSVGLALGLLLGLISGLSGAGAAPLPGKVEIGDLEQSRKWRLVVDGDDENGAKIFYSDYEVAWLVQSPKLGTLLISPRGRSVQRLEGRGMRALSAARAALDGGGDAETVATYAPSGQAMAFELDGRSVVLEPSPPLVGRQDRDALEQRHPIFAERGKRYGDRAGLKAPPPRPPENVTVRVYFGPESAICERIVPKIMAVEKAWKQVRFEYYGLPEILTDDEQARAHRVSGVPTILILQDGREIDRLTGRVLDDPAGALRGALAGL